VERLWSLHDLGEFIECQFLQLQEWLEVMGPGQKFLTRVGSAIYGLGLNFKNFPKKCQIFQFFFLFGQKKLLQVGSESTRVGLFFTAGQK